MTAELEAALDLATRLSREAASEILRVRTKARAGATEKPEGQGPVTEADLAADRILYRGMTAAFPDDLVITEERWTVGESIASAPRAWFIDPLDGTQEFVRGGADYAVMIGLCVDGEPVLGVVTQPETGIVWRALCPPGGPTLCERLEPSGSSVPLDVRGEQLPGRETPRAAVSRSHPSRLVSFLAGALGVQVVKKGSVGLKIGLIVDGEADLYVSGSRRIKVWDTAGPHAILKAAGGSMTALDGTPLRYHGTAAHGGGVRAWTPTAQERVGPRLEEALARWREMNR